MEKVYLTPFNIKGVYLYHQLVKQNIPVSGFFDANPFLWNQEYDKVEIYPRCYVPNAKVIICAHENGTKNAIKKDLIERGYNEKDIEANNERNLVLNVYDVDEINVNQLLSMFSKSDMAMMGTIDKIVKLKKIKQYGISLKDVAYEEIFGLNKKELFNDKIFLDRFELIITNRCSLKCKKCAAGIQYIEKPEDLKLEQILKDYDRMLELIDWTENVVIMGGEPFLNFNLDKILDGIFKNVKTKEKVGGVKVITNGTIIPQTNILESISKYGVIVWISDYGKQSRNIGTLISAFAKYKINYCVMTIRKWSNVIQLNNTKKIESKECLLYKRKKECVTRCRTIANGKFYLCSLLKTMDYLEIEPFDEMNYVDLYGKMAKEKIKDMLSMDKPLPNACSFCSGCSEKNWTEAEIEAAEQVKNPLWYLKKRI